MGHGATEWALKAKVLRITRTVHMLQSQCRMGRRKDTQGQQEEERQEKVNDPHQSF